MRALTLVLIGIAVAIAVVFIACSGHTKQDVIQSVAPAKAAPIQVDTTWHSVQLDSCLFSYRTTVDNKLQTTCTRYDHVFTHDGFAEAVLLGSSDH